MPSFEVVNINDTINPYFKFIWIKHKIYFLIAIGLIIIFTFLGLKKSYSDTCESTSTKYIIHQDEICKDCVYYTYPRNKIKYILWTGGYDSTFLLCWYFLVRDEPVQPIYIMCKGLDSKYGIIGRKNQDQEIKTMKHIRKLLIEKYPYKKARLLPTYYVYSIKKNNKITKDFIYLHRRQHFFSRDISQYERIARLSLEWDYPLHIGLEKCGTGLDEATTGSRMNEGTDNCMLIPLNSLINNKKPKELDIFRKLRFSIVHLTKEDMKQISLDSNNYFYDILQMTISCWYPDNNGKTCNNCPMCKSRII